MTRRDRLWATLRGGAVDRRAVNFHEVGGFVVDPADPGPFNIYNAPAWQPLLHMAWERSDVIRMLKVPATPRDSAARDRKVSVRTWDEGRSRFKETTVRCGGARMLRELTRRDADVDTVWMLEPLLKDESDIEAWLALPEELFDCDHDATRHVEEERRLGDRGLVMVDFPDPLSRVAKLMSMEFFTVVAFTAPALLHRMLARAGRLARSEAEFMAARFPGRLWRLTGAEYATEPYLSPQHFRDYWLAYTGPLVGVIHATGGLARVHAHGRVRNVLDAIVESGADAIDPIEPPPQGDVELREVRERHGDRLVLFGNLEIADLENLPPPEFREKVRRALEEGDGGRGFVLMPSAAPYGRAITANALANYETMLDAVGA